MKETVDAIFEDGVFRPVQRPGVSEGERVRLTVVSLGKPAAQDVLKLAARVYEGLSSKDIDDIEEMARRRPLFARAAP